MLGLSKGLSKTELIKECGDNIRLLDIAVFQLLQVLTVIPEL
jgi:hypothetical protein